MPLSLRLALSFSVATAFAIGLAGLVFVAQLRDNLYDALDAGLPPRYSAAYQELASERVLAPPRATDELILVQGLDGTILGANQSVSFPP